MSETNPADLSLAEEILRATDCFGADYKCTECDARSECVEDIERIARMIAADRAREREANERVIKLLAGLLREFAALKELAEGADNGHQA